MEKRDAQRNYDSLLGSLGARHRGGIAAITCGGSPCAPQYTPACCTVTGTGVAGDKLEFVGRAADKCGTDLSQYSDAIAGICLQLDQPGTLDTSCPDVASVTPGQPPTKGCCTDQGYCGSFEGFLPLGCSYAGARGKPCGAGKDAGAGDAAAPDGSH